MIDLTKFLASVRERLSKATPGPWRVADNDSGGVICAYKSRRDPNWSDWITHHVNMQVVVGQKQSNEQLIANAPADLAKLIAICEIQADALNYAKGQVIGAVEAHYWQMGKEYLAKDAANKACAYLDITQEKVAAICAGEAGVE